jgi:hypothetical protein
MDPMFITTLPISNEKCGSQISWDILMLSPSNAELNPICHLLALLGAHPILHVSRIRVKHRRNKTNNAVDTFMLYYSLSQIHVSTLQGIHSTGWTVRGSNPGGRRDFMHPSRPALEPAQPPIPWVPGLFPGVKRLRRAVDHPPHLAPRLKKV